MTYNRLEAKPIPGEHCRFCGDDASPLVKTPCCEQWICCETSYLSYRGGGYCHRAWKLEHLPLPLQWKTSGQMAEVRRMPTLFWGRRIQKRFWRSDEYSPLLSLAIEEPKKSDPTVRQYRFKSWARKSVQNDRFWTPYTWWEMFFNFSRAYGMDQ